MSPEPQGLAVAGGDRTAQRCPQPSGQRPRRGEEHKTPSVRLGTGGQETEKKTVNPLFFLMQREGAKEKESILS